MLGLLGTSNLGTVRPANEAAIPYADTTNALFLGGVAVMVEDYTGALIRVRRNSDNAEQDISAASGSRKLDIAALDTFLSATTGAIKTIYNQLETGFDLDQTTTSSQPPIDSSIEDENGFLPYYNSTGDDLLIDSNITGDARDFTVYDIVDVMNIPDPSTQNSVFQIGALWNTAGSIGLLGQVPNRYLTSSAFNNADWSVGLRSQPQVTGFTCDSSDVNIHQSTTKFSSGSPNNAGTFVGGFVSRNSLGYPNFVRRYGFAIYDGERGTSNTTDIQNLESMFSITPRRNRNLLLIGDSITQGTGATALNGYTKVADTSLSPRADTYNCAIFGKTAAFFNTEKADYNGAYNSVKTYDDNVCVIAVGTNDINAGTTGSNLWTNEVVPLIQHFDGLGFTVLVGTIINRSSWSSDPTTKETERVAFNDEVLDSTNQSTYNFSAIDYTGITVSLGDGIHPDQTGHNQMAVVFAAAVNAV